MRAFKIDRIFNDIESWFPGWYPEVIFDVGANKGQSSKVYVKRYPEADVQAFEPHPEVYKKLFQKVPQATCWNMGLSSKTGIARLTDKKVSTGNRITEDGPIEIVLTEGRDFCRSEGYDHIDFMKIDAEGHDLEVLIGFDLDIVDFIQIECSANPHMKQSVPFVNIYDYLTYRGFYLFAIYDQAWEFKQGPRQTGNRTIGGSLIMADRTAPVLRRIDPVFIHERMAGPLSVQDLDAVTTIRI